LTFLVDAQLPPSLARWISIRAHEASHVFDVAMHTAGDAAIWEFVATNSCVLLTKDEDFVDDSCRVQHRLRSCGSAKGNCSNDALLTWLEPLWSQTVKRLEQGERLIELRG
jgi:predicted nuclease of predicted toxin-antitoxin system